MKIYKVLLLLLFSFSNTVFAQLDTNNTNAQLLDFDLEQLVTTPSKVKFSQQESPGIVTLITDKEIRAQGANDLIDVLKLIPGISFQSDVQGVVGIGMRGIWGHEGKVLMLIDGQEMNELLYGNLALGGHYDVTQIKRIEVVRGPGSSVYGGFAELGVINIITKNGDDLSGVEANVSAGFYNDSYAHRNISVKAGKKYGNGSFSVLGFVGQNQKSNQTYTDIYGTSTNLKGNSAANPANLNIGAEYKNLSAKVILDAYMMNSKVTYDVLDSVNLPNTFKSINAELKYKYKVNSKLNVVPKVQYINQYPWQNNIAFSTGSAILNTQKTLGNIEVDYNPNRKINILFGSETFLQSAQNKELTKSPLFNIGNTDYIQNITSSAYVQGTIKNKFANITLGGRYLNNNIFGSAFSPRVAITKAFDDLHFKLLYSEAFKTPTLMNIGLNKAIKPEHTTVLELECGYKLNSSLDITANIFSVLIKDPIVYEAIDDRDYFNNKKQTGSLGTEITLKYHTDKWNINANYAYYNTNGLNQVDNYTIANSRNSVLAFANHTANLNLTYLVNDDFTINNTFSYVGSRYGYKYGSYNFADSTAQELPIDATLQWNIFVNKNNMFVDGLSIGAGITNLLNQEMYFVQPYNSWNSIYPTFNRSFTIKLGYKF